MTGVVTVNLLGAILTLSLAAVSWRRPRVRGARQLSVLMLALAWWTAFEAAIALAPGFDAKVLCTKLQYLGLAMAPPLFLRFALAYSGSENRVAQAGSGAVWSACVATVAMVWTNDLHGLAWRSASLDPTGRLLVLVRGPWFWVFVAASYFALLAGMVAVGGLVMRTGRRLRRQAVVVLAASFLPWVGNALYIGKIIPIPGLDWTPIAFSLTGLLLSFAVLRLGFLALVPVARGAVVDTMSDGVLVLDNMGKLVDLNPAAERLTGIGDGETRYGSPALPEALARVLAAAVNEVQDEIVLAVEGRDRVMELRASPFATRSGRPLGRLVILRDITERRAAEQERERLVAELQSAAAEISTLRGLLPICSSCKRVRDDTGYWNQIETYISRHADVRFSHGLCPDCARKLYPEIFNSEPPQG